MVLFHVSSKLYEIGEIISNEMFETTEYYQNSIIKNKNWIDDFLDERKPINAPTRQKAIFAFENIENCAAYKNSDKGEKFYYKVEMQNPIACPMCLTDALKFEENDLNNRLRTEYWNPNLDWKYLEYLGSEIKVIERLAKPGVIASSKGLSDYLHDRDMIKWIIR